MPAKGRPVIVVCGGADDLTDGALDRAGAIIGAAVASAAEVTGAVLVDGGTSAGVMRLTGQARARWPAALPVLVGVAPAGAVTYPGDPSGEGVPLEENHSHFILADSNQWGGETSLLMSVAETLAGDGHVVMVLAGGGPGARSEVLEAARRRWPVFVVSKTGGLADEVLGLWTTYRIPRRRLAALILRRTWKYRRRPPLSSITDPELREIITHADIRPVTGCEPRTFARPLAWELQEEQVLKDAWLRFATYDQLAIRLRSMFTRFQALILALGVLATLLALIDNQLKESALHWAVIVLPILVSVLIAVASRRAVGQRWVMLRAAAESIKAAIYDYRTLETTPAKDHAKTVAAGRQQLASQVNGIETRLMQTEASSGPLTPYQGPLPPEMDGAGRGDDGLSRLGAERYLQIRVGDQLSYFHRRIRGLNVRRNLLQFLAIGSGAAGAILAAANHEVWIGLTAGASAAVLAYLGYLQVDNTIVTYNQTAHRLAALERSWRALSPAQQNNTAFKHLVTGCEAALATELSGWVQQMNDALHDLRRDQAEAASRVDPAENAKPEQHAGGESDSPSLPPMCGPVPLTCAGKRGRGTNLARIAPLGRARGGGTCWYVSKTNFGFGRRSAGAGRLTPGCQRWEPPCEEFFAGGWFGMNLWGAAPLIAVAMLSGAGAHLATGGPAASPAPTGSSTSSPSPSPSVASFASISPNPDLVETAPGQWTTTVPVDNTSPSCPGPVTSYWLQTISPNGMIQGNVIPKQTATPTPAASQASANESGSAPGSVCEVTVQFSGLHQVPVSAVLAIDQPGSSVSLQLTVNRTVTLFYYLGIPIIVGAALALAVVLFSVLRVKIYDQHARRIRPWRRDLDYWRHPLTAAGTWSANDSWATNISGGLVVIGSLIAAQPASATAFFPGVALDRFIPVNLAVGAILAAAPLVFGILYTRWTAHDPAATADATMRLPLPTGVQAILASPADATLRLPTGVQAILASPADAALQKGTVVRIGDDEKRLAKLLIAHLEPGKVAAMHGTRIQFAADTAVTLPADTSVTLPAGTAVIALPSGAAVWWRVLGWGIRGRFRRTSLDAAVTVALPEGGRVRLEPVDERLPVDQPAAQGGSTIRLRRWTRVQLPDGKVVLLVRPALVSLSQDVASTLSRILARKARVRFPDEVVLAGETTATVSLRPARAAGLIGTEPGPRGPVAIMLPKDTTAKLLGGVRARFEGIPGTTGMIVVPSGAAITVVGDATVTWTDNGVKKLRQVQFGKGIQVPPCSRITVLPGGAGTPTWMAIPSTSDLAVSAASTLRISGGPGTLVMAEGDMVQAGDAHAPKPVTVVSYPADISTENGAKISVVGTADLTLPQGTVIKAPHRPAAPLLRDRQLQTPQSSNVLVGTLGMVLAAAAVTMFGIGMEVGLACVLTYGLSAASLVWRSVMLAGSILVGIFVLRYAVAAVRALADPRPGSALSSTGGTSFTL